MSHRTFNEEEVAALFRRASELQADEVRDDSSARPGLELDELLAIAADAGLDPDHVRRAADELNAPSLKARKGRARVQGSDISTERWVDHPVPSEVVEDIVAELRHIHDSSWGGEWGMGHYGMSTTQTIGRSIEWKHTDLWGIETRVFLQSRHDSFRVRISRRSEWGGSGSWQSMAAMAALFAGFFAAPAAGSYLVGLAVAIAVLVVLLPLARAHNGRWVEKQQRDIEELADSIMDQAVRFGVPQQGAESPPEGREAGTRSSATIDLPDEESERDHRDAPRRGRTR